MEPKKVLNWDTTKNLIGLAVVLGVLVVLARYLDIETVRAQIERAGVWAPLLFILAKASTIIVAPLGGSPLYPIAGAIFGFWKGALLLIIGDTIGGVVSFLLARMFGKKLVERMLEGSEGLLSKAVTLMGTPKGYLLARFSFIGFPELASWGAGLTKINFFTFLLIYVAVGAIPAIGIAGLGALLVESSTILLPVVVIASMTLAAVPIALFAAMLQKQTKE